MLHRTILATVIAFAASCTIYEDPGDPPDVYTPDAGVATPDASDPWPDPWPDAGDGDPWPSPDAGGGDPWPADDAGPGDPQPDAGGGDPWPVPDAGGGDPWPAPDAGSGVDCGAITSEAVCIVTPECRALYEGINCHCYADGTCTCDSWLFDRCE